MGNFLCADADPVKACTIAAPHAFHVHAKDFLFKSGEYDCPEGFFSTLGKNHIRGTVVGHGTVPVKNCVNALKRGGYDGWLSAEMIPNYKHHTDAIIYNTSYARDRILGRK